MNLFFFLQIIILNNIITLNKISNNSLISPNTLFSCWNCLFQKVRSLNEIRVFLKQGLWVAVSLQPLFINKSPPLKKKCHLFLEDTLIRFVAFPTFWVLLVISWCHWTCSSILYVPCKLLEVWLDSGSKFFFFLP